MAQYEAVESFEFEGKTVEAGEILELGELSAADLGDKVKPVEAPEPQTEEDAKEPIEESEESSEEESA